MIYLQIMEIINSNLFEVILEELREKKVVLSLA